MSPHPVTARAYWKVLMDNASSLVAERHLPCSSEVPAQAHSYGPSPGRARQALWLYGTFSEA